MAQPRQSQPPPPVRNYQLDKLEGPNYLTWVTLLLKRVGVWHITSGSMVRLCTSSAQIWKSLQSHYHHEDLITRVSALKKLLAARLLENISTIHFIDEWCSMLLLAALPSSWRSFITTQASVIGLTVDSLVARILQEETLRSNTEASESASTLNSTRRLRYGHHRGHSNSTRSGDSTRRQS
ncbi:hypothetical protein KP509_1Z148700 [Ceratopteris richardii]|nr:hypothetical protein KP509_1Z148700 [Ceratopteris richardii]